MIKGYRDRKFLLQRKFWDAEIEEPIGGPLRRHENSMVYFSVKDRDGEKGEIIGDPLREHKNSWTALSLAVTETLLFRGLPIRQYDRGILKSNIRWCLYPRTYILKDLCLRERSWKDYCVNVCRETLKWGKRCTHCIPTPLKCFWSDLCCGERWHKYYCVRVFVKLQCASGMRKA